MTWRGILHSDETLNAYHRPPATYSAGHAVGIIAIDLVYPKLPGNVVNATTFPFPVLYREVSFDIELLFEGSPEIEDEIVAAARYLERQGVRAIIGACGYFAHFQEKVSAAVDVPVFLSSLCQLPLIKLGLPTDRKIAVFAASGDNLDSRILEQVGAHEDDLVVQDVGSLESFSSIRWGREELDNAALTRDLSALAADLVRDHPEVGAVLLECSDLPPYACEIQRACGLPVFDFITLIKWVHTAVVQQPYYGYF